MKKKSKSLRFFLKKRQIDLFNYLLQKKNINQKETQKLTIQFIYFFLSRTNNLQLNRKKREIRSMKYTDLLFERQKFLLKNVQKVKDYLYLFESTNLLGAYSNFLLKQFFDNLITKHFFFNLINLKKRSLNEKKKDIFLKKILLMKKKLFLKKSSFRLFEDEGIFLKSSRRFNSYIWKNSYIAFYRYDKRRPRTRFKKPVNHKLWWHEWLLQKFFSAYYGFFCVKKFYFFKKKNKFKKKNSLDRVLLLEKTLLMTLLKLELFHSFSHVKNLIKYGGVTVDGRVVTNPYLIVKNSSFIQFKPGLRKTILKMYLFRLKNKQVFRLFPSYFEYNLKTLTFTRWRDPFKNELQIIHNNGAKNPLIWL